MQNNKKTNPQAAPPMAAMPPTYASPWVALVILLLRHGGRRGPRPTR